MAYRLITLFLLTLLISGCSKVTDEAGNELKIVATTGMIADAVKNIVGNKAEVTALMGPGVDPHLYKATQGDLSKLTSADLILYNGLHLEGKMGEVLSKLGVQKNVIGIGNRLDTKRLYRTPEFDNNFDPHIWFDVSLWKDAVNIIGESISEIDSANATYYKTNLSSYMESLDSLDQFVKESIQQLDSSQRILITAHDAFGYFGRAYGMQVKGLQGISTLSEYGLRDVSNLVDFIIENKIKAIFVETSVSEKAINAVIEGCKSKGFDVKIGGRLYSDAMGPESTPEGTYIGMVTSNVNTIVNGLKHD